MSQCYLGSESKTSMTKLYFEVFIANYFWSFNKKDPVYPSRFNRHGCLKLSMLFAGGASFVEVRMQVWLSLLDWLQDASETSKSKTKCHKRLTLIY